MVRQWPSPASPGKPRQAQASPPFLRQPFNASGSQQFRWVGHIRGVAEALLLGL